MSSETSGSLSRRNLVGAAGAAVIAAGIGDATLSATQDAMPEGTPGGTPETAPATGLGEIIVAATGLANPRGFAWGPDGEFYVALAGSGGTKITTSTDASPEDQVLGPTLTGTTASVVQIIDGCGTPVATGLPSTQDPYGDVQGPVAVAMLDGELYILQDATGGYEAVGPDFPNGLYARTPNGGVRLVSDLSTYVAADPASNLYHVLELGEPFAMVPWNGGFLVIDANQGLLLRVETSGTVGVLADISEGHPVPTAIALAPDGGVYVGFLTSSPHIDGTAKVIKVEPDGTVSDFWTGLTTVTGLAVTPDGTLFALEMATGNQTTEPNILPNTGRLVRQTGPASLDVVVEGMDFPISMALGPDNGLYVSMPAIATDGELGGIVRIDPTLAGPVTMPTGLFAGSACAQPVSAEGTPDTVPAASPETTPASTDANPETGVAPNATTDDPGGKPGIASLAVLIQGNAFTPAQIEVTAGGIVTWTNLDSGPHSVTATDGSFDSGTLDSGEEWVHAFDSAGTFAYTSTTDPAMQATVVVTP